jgi:hypothetical protein
MEVGRFVCGLASLACIAALSGVVHAQERSIFSGPSIYETGRIGGMSVDSPSPTASPGDLTGRTEKSIVPAAASLDEPRRPPQGLINQRILQREIDAHFEALDGCRISVARAKQLHPSQLTADNLLLRWRIETDGTITTTAVVATSPTDLELMDCVKRSMSRWTFTAPRGGTIEVERTFTFRKRRDPAPAEAPASTPAPGPLPASAEPSGDPQP